MTQLVQQRINFINLLHNAFLVRKGYGAFAYISVPDVMSLFDEYLNSNETTDVFIDRYINNN